MQSDYSTLTDDQLLQLLRSNDEGAFTEIFNRYWEQMSLYVLRVIRSEEDARDIVQEVLLSIWKRRQELEVRGSLVAYLLKSVRNLSIRYIERNITRHQFLATLSEHFGHLETPTAASIAELKQLEERVDKAIAGLPSKMQRIYLLSRHENLSYREIAHQLGIAETTVKKQVSNALKIIRTEIGGLSSTAILYLALLLD
ncbi:RNA polymerase sigma-70 factor [Chitinophaga sp. 212800010-3]|uniref:RNA polymerase sigma-70 factor n=1 Tax=unclassified Chitinophaga TaxID=2619133 RepID=UPI002DF4AA08|nr:RNA polymerase sigma-70 factor [Chitinophaga sp. 212800010-3]